MINHQAVTVDEFTDTELVTRSLAGDREAFSRIVNRYQVLICSLAYSRIGHLGQSEDVAQETFITAWKRLRLLREPAKLRAWLCGIVNHRIHKALRREGREPVCLAESLELVDQVPAADALPSDQTISREEEAILWRALERVPELYRAPLVLFYREHESVAAVAAQLDLTEDAVKQRLSRGRKLLQEEVQSFVESTLRRTAPGRAFSSSVVAALPAMQLAGAGVGMAGKGALATKGFLGVCFVVLAPFLGIILGVISQWFVIRATTPAGRERRWRTFELVAVWACVIGLAGGGETAVRALGHHWEWSDRTFFYALAGFWWLYTAGLVAWFMAMAGRDWAASQQREAAGEVARLGVLEIVVLAVGLHLSIFLWVIALALKMGDVTTAVIVAVLAASLAGWLIFKLRGQYGAAAGRTSGLHYALCALLILGVLNLRLDVWLAGRYQTSLAGIRQLLPLWLVPVLSLALVAWVVALIAFHHRGKGRG